MTTTTDIAFSPMNAEDFVVFWPTFKEIVASAQTYAIDPAIRFDDAYRLWCQTPLATWVAKDPSGTLLGSYYVTAPRPKR
ncbi:hypothetical protein GLV89_05110 [Halomonas alkaliantarctica]|nr:hypothetical protein [Halomonas alkaliantarctica]